MSFRIMEGGADTGFRHVEPEKYEPRLMRYKREGRRVVATEVIIFPTNAERLLITVRSVVEAK